MEYDLLQQKTAAACRHLDELVGKLQSTPGERSLLEEAVEELSSTLEELHVAGEMIENEQDAAVEAYRLAEAERQRYRDLFNFAPDAYLVTDAHGTVEEANEAAGRLLQIRTDFLVGKPLTIFLKNKTQRALHSWMILLAQEKTSLAWEGILHPRQGSPVYVDVRVTAIRCEGRLVRLRWLIRDISERKRLEDELREHVEQLAQANRHKDEFLAMLGHELRNPLAPLQNALQIVQQRPENLDWACEIMQRQVQHMKRLVDDLLDVSRIDRHLVEVRQEPLDLVDLVRKTITDHRQSLESAKLSLVLELPEQPAWVRGDATRLAQVVGNLLHNAVKFTPPGGQVTVQLAVDEPGGWVTVSVRDTGIGIALDLLPHVFEVFTQADHSLDRSRGGLGLGLALVKRLVELHGGQVQVASMGPGQGAELTFRLPLERQAAAVAPLEPPVAHAARPQRIVLIEDNRDVADSLRVLLETEGHQVVLAYSGVAGLEAARQAQPDLVLCDIGLPDLDGYAIAQALRHDPATATLRLAALTGYGHDEARQRVREAGFDVHLTKPVGLAEIEAYLASLPARPV